MIWVMVHPQATPAMLGYLPDMFSEDDPRPAREQADANYRHGGGWRAFRGFTMLLDSLACPGDPPMRLIAETRLRDEVIRLYEADWVAIIQPDGSYEISRMD